MFLLHWKIITILTIERDTVEQVCVTKTYFQNEFSVRPTYRRIWDYFGVRRRSSEVTIHKMVHRCKSTGLCAVMLQSAQLY